MSVYAGCKEARRVCAHAGTELNNYREGCPELPEGGRQGQHVHKLWQNSELAELSREVFRVSFCLLICLLPTGLSLLLKHRNVFAIPVQSERVYTWTGLVGDPALCGQNIFPLMVLINARLSNC